MKYHKHTGVSMTVDNINVEETVKRVTELIAAEKDLSPTLKASLECRYFETPVDCCALKRFCAN